MTFIKQDMSNPYNQLSPEFSAKSYHNFRFHDFYRRLRIQSSQNIRHTSSVQLQKLFPLQQEDYKMRRSQMRQVQELLLYLPPLP